MRIEQSNQYFTQNTGLGAKPKSLSEKYDVQIFSGNAAGESDGKTNEKSGSFRPSHFTKVLQLGVGANVQAVSNRLSVEDDEDIEAVALAEQKVLAAKKEAMNDLLKKLGINGEITSWGMQTVPNNYTTYYVETEGNAKNLFILELENGETLFTETERDVKSRDSAQEFAELHRELFGMGKGEPMKLSINELKKLFAKFFNVDELKDLILSFTGGGSK